MSLEIAFGTVYVPVKEVPGLLGLAQVGHLTLGHEQQLVKLGKDLRGRLVDGADDCPTLKTWKIL